LQIRVITAAVGTTFTWNHTIIVWIWK